MKQRLLYIWYKVIAFPFRLLPINKNMVVFENFFGRGYGDNPKYVVEEILNRKINNIKLIWLVKGKYYDDIPSCVKQVKRGTLRELYYLSTAHVWVDNSRKPLGTTKRKNQFYIQLWHGGIGMKKVEGANIEKLDNYYIKSAIKDSKMIDLFISSSDNFTDEIKKYFWYDGEILESGLPRTDILINSRNSSISNNILLYAPTFRDNGDSSVYNLDYMELKKQLELKFGGIWKIYVRLHPNASYLQDKIEYNEYIINASNFGDINDLILKSDILITDYSSCIFDAIYAGKKTFMYAPDLDNYIKLRGLSIDLNNLPFSISYNIDELYNNIKEFDNGNYKKNVDFFLNNIKSFETGDASRVITDRIIEVINSD